MILESRSHDRRIAIPCGMPALFVMQVAFFELFDDAAEGSCEEVAPRLREWWPIKLVRPRPPEKPHDFDKSIKVGATVCPTIGTPSSQRFHHPPHLLPLQCLHSVPHHQPHHRFPPLPPLPISDLHLSTYGVADGLRWRFRWTFDMREVGGRRRSSATRAKAGPRRGWSQWSTCLRASFMTYWLVSCGHRGAGARGGGWLASRCARGRGGRWRRGGSYQQTDARRARGL